MYEKILVALDNSEADLKLLPHISALAHIHHSHLLLLHVADGWVARNFEEFELKESDEMKQDREYLHETAKQLERDGLKATTHLALGNPPEEILIVAEKEKCDLIAMTSHGHRFIGDLFYGSTIEEVRHKTTIPILIVSSWASVPL
jgi:nucleotide-binding universal stress UspA family protein